MKRKSSPNELKAAGNQELRRQLSAVMEENAQLQRRAADIEAEIVQLNRQVAAKNALLREKVAQLMQASEHQERQLSAAAEQNALLLQKVEEKEALIAELMQANLGIQTGDVLEADSQGEEATQNDLDTLPAPPTPSSDPAALPLPPDEDEDENDDDGGDDPPPSNATVAEPQTRKKMKRKSSPNELKVIKKQKNKKHNIGELSEYEKMVQKNRDEKIAFLLTLRIDEVKEGLNEAVNSLKPKNLPSGTKSPNSVMTAQVPTRKSSRLEKMDYKAAEAIAHAEAEKEVEKELTFEESITGDNVYADFVRDFDDLEFKTPKPFTDYVSCFKNMKIDESKIAKVAKGMITAMAFHPMEEKVIVSAGNKYGAIGFWHVNSDSVPYEFKPHVSAVPCLKFNSDFPNQILSCSYDGTMRCGDMEKKVFDEVFNISDKTSCNYFDFTSPTTTIVCHKNGNISLVDIRSDSKSAEKSHKCHEYSVKTVSVHPVNKSYFVSADKEEFSLWDLRKLEKKPVIEVHCHREVTASAFFSPVTGNSILTTLADDSLCLFDSSKLGSALTLDTEVRQNNSNSRALSTCKATWLPNTDDALVIGSMDYPRRIEVFNNHLDNIYNFQDEYLSSITHTNVFHPSLPVLAGGNSCGKVYIFS